MQYRNLGQSGPKVSIVGLGGNNFGTRIDEAATARIVNEALDQGITLFDTSDMYGDGLSEVFLGKALGARRQDVLLNSKFGWPLAGAPDEPRGSRKYIFQAAEASLRRLNTDYIDVYQYHIPDGRTPIEETITALNDLVAQGKIRYLGSSNLSGWQIAEADCVARGLGPNRFVSAQNHWNLLDRALEAEVVPACEHFGVRILPYFPLANGFLTGKYRRDEEHPEGSRLAMWKAGIPGLNATDAKWDMSAAEHEAEITTNAGWSTLERLSDFADERGHTILELALSWLAAQPVVASILAGATSPQQVRGNAAAANAWQLSDEELSQLDAIRVNTFGESATFSQASFQRVLGGA